MAGRRKTTGILVYNLLIREVSRINKLLPEDRKLSIKERRQLVSEKIYPKYKKTSKSKIRLIPLRKKLYRTIQRLPRKPTCDVLDVPEGNLDQVLWHAMDENIRKLPKCIWIKINAADFGQTKIFNTRDYEYTASGLQDISNKINEWVRKQTKGKRNQVYPYYDGIIQVRPKMKNDGKPESYYIEYVIKGTDFEVEITEIADLPKRKKKTKKQQKDINVRKYIEEQTKKLTAEKSKVKALRRSVLKKLKEFEAHIKYLKRRQGRKKDQKAIRKEFNIEYKLEKARVEKNLTKKIITKYQYESLIKILKTGYQQ